MNIISKEIESLVSVIVMTYNSSKFVIDTLESIKVQTYNNIELIISDDASSDGTIKLCEDWKAENNFRFWRIEILTVEKNTGTASNLNRALNRINGEWVKVIAGDDLLMQDCIVDNLNCMIKYSEIEVLFSNGLLIDEKSKIIGECGGYHKEFGYSAEDQHRVLLENPFVLSPSVFYRRSLIRQMGGYDESIPLIEDLPMWLKITKSGRKLYHLNMVTVFYRKHSNSVMSQSKLSKKYQESLLSLFNSDYYNSLLANREYNLWINVQIQKNIIANILVNNVLKYSIWKTMYCMYPPTLFQFLFSSSKYLLKRFIRYFEKKTHYK